MTLNLNISVACGILALAYSPVLVSAQNQTGSSEAAEETAEITETPENAGAVGTETEDVTATAESNRSTDEAVETVSEAPEGEETFAPPV
ncbi:MAG: hypothetical protein AAF491_08740, partial [Verrucomicrobiota bacterium]